MSKLQQKAFFHLYSKNKNNVLQQSSKQIGFTIIELLVVIAIIGLLSTIVVISFNDARQKARNTKRLNDIKNIQTALIMCADSQEGDFPDTTGGTDIYSRVSMKCLGLRTNETCFTGRQSGLDSLQTCLLPFIQAPADPSRENAIFDAYLYTSACHISHLPPNGGKCIYWLPEGTINAEACFPGVVGSSGSDVCGVSCSFCTLKLED